MKMGEAPVKLIEGDMVTLTLKWGGNNEYWLEAQTVNHAGSETIIRKHASKVTRNHLINARSVINAILKEDE